MLKSLSFFISSLWRYKILSLIVLAAGVYATSSYFLVSTSESPFHMARVQRADLIVTVSATGTLEPQEVIDVGAQIAGKIDAFGEDIHGNAIDYGSEVEEGAVLARIEDTLYVAALEEAKAQLKKAEAELSQSQAKLTQARQDWRRAEKLGPSDALSQTSFDAFRAGYLVAESSVKVAEANITQAQAAVMRAERNLAFCTITSPVRGVIIDRRVNIGQTVVASLNAPSLFLIAKDLRHMQVWVAVNEADIGSIRSGQNVTFSVDAFPGEEFRGVVSRIRLNATMNQNVVVYVVEVDTDNSSGRLLPYLTANVRFEVSKHNSVLQIPNAALRWRPKPEMIAAEYRADFSSTRSPRARGNETERHAGFAGTLGDNRTVWVRAGNFVRPVPVESGESDSIMTEIREGELQEGDEVIVGEQVANRSSSGKTNPFAPQVIRGRGGR